MPKIVVRASASVAARSEGGTGLQLPADTKHQRQAVVLSFLVFRRMEDRALSRGEAGGLGIRSCCSTLSPNGGNLQLPSPWIPSFWIPARGTSANTATKAPAHLKFAELSPPSHLASGHRHNQRILFVGGPRNKGWQNFPAWRSSRPALGVQQPTLSPIFFPRTFLQHLQPFPNTQSRCQNSQTVYAPQPGTRLCSGASFHRMSANSSCKAGSATPPLHSLVRGWCSIEV